MLLGKRPKKGQKVDLPKPTELMKQRDFALELDKNLNKTVVVANPTGRGPGQPGFHCDTCNRTYKDTTGYLDHINGRQRKNHSYRYISTFLTVGSFPRFKNARPENNY